MLTIMSANFAFPVSGDRAYLGATSDVPVHTGQHGGHYTHGSSDYLQFAHEDAFAATGTGAASEPSAPGIYHAPSHLATRMHRSESVSSTSNSVFHVDTPPSDYQASQFDDVSQFSGGVSRLSPLSTRDGQDAESSAALASSSSRAPAAGTSARPTANERRPSYGKSRREKPRLGLAPDQPLTTQGKPRCRVYVARSRKIRCDGAKPACHNCGRRTDQGSPCTYDTEPKRRGPDKTPGARQRSMTAGKEEGEPKKRSRRRTSMAHLPRALQIPRARRCAGPLPLTARSLPSPVSLRALSSPTGVRPIAAASQGSTSGSHEGYAPGSGGAHSLALGSNMGTASTSMQPMPVSQPHVIESVAYPQMSDASLMQQGHPYGHRQPVKLEIPAEPSSRYARETWWDVVLSLYSASYEYPNGYPAPLPPGMRATATQLVHADLHVLFRYSSSMDPSAPADVEALLAQLLMSVGELINDITGPEGTLPGILGDVGNLVAELTSVGSSAGSLTGPGSSGSSGDGASVDVHAGVGVHANVDSVASSGLSSPVLNVLELLDGTMKDLVSRLSNL
ncbi:hypothetical protein EVJ58_g9765 [Rhodofomes roseus]|uniref:Zn(2)-C6 fungal-type domain-containing protein n=1 Tax=Rhodofomes roseus TaxID=34475 RepID=A0A4Y9XSY6_9APHY|nr:hypothetical protein EVJ58_g9765 [Rhodofomes roseus]